MCRQDRKQQQTALFVPSFSGWMILNESTPANWDDRSALVNLTKLFALCVSRRRQKIFSVIFAYSPLADDFRWWEIAQRLHRIILDKRFAEICWGRRGKIIEKCGSWTFFQILRWHKKWSSSGKPEQTKQDGNDFSSLSNAFIPFILNDALFCQGKKFRSVLPHVALTFLVIYLKNSRALHPTPAPQSFQWQEVEGEVGRWEEGASGKRQKWHLVRIPEFFSRRWGGMKPRRTLR